MLSTSFPLRGLPTLICCLLLSLPALSQRTEGMASYYADRFHNRPTSTGETYDKDAFTAASKDYPYGTRLQVTNVVSGQSVEVRVNDCGPHNPRRIVDLSRAAAGKIGLLRMGVAKVRVRVLEMGERGPTCDRGAWEKAEREREERESTAGGGPLAAAETTGAVTPAAAPPPPTVPTAAPAATPATETTAKGVEPTPAVQEFPEDVMLFGVQVGAFGKADNANALLTRLRGAGFTDAWMAKVGTVNRVFTGKFYFQKEAEALMERVREAGFDGATVRRVQ